MRGRRRNDPRGERRRTRYLGALLLVSLLAAVWSYHEPVWAALRTHPYFAITHFAVRGIGPLLTKQDLFGWLGVSEQNARIWDVPPRRVRARLELHPLIARASVRREFPNSFEIEVRERRPHAIVLLDRLYYVGRNGDVLLPLAATHDPDYPIITGLSTRTTAGYRTWALRRALRLNRLCERMSCFGGISEIHVDAARGMVLYPTRPRVPIVLGWGSWREKIKRAERVLESWTERERQLGWLDLRYRNQVVARPRDPGATEKGGRPARGRVET